MTNIPQPTTGARAACVLIPSSNGKSTFDLGCPWLSIQDGKSNSYVGLIIFHARLTHLAFGLWLCACGRNPTGAQENNHVGVA